MSNFDRDLSSVREDLNSLRQDVASLIDHMKARGDEGLRKTSERLGSEAKGALDCVLGELDGSVIQFVQSIGARPFLAMTVVGVLGYVFGRMSPSQKGN